MPEQARRVSPIDGGMVDGKPFYLLKPNECSALKNMRVYKGELRTSKGYVSSTSSVIQTGVTSVYGLGHHVLQATGADYFVASTAGGHWRLVGDVKDMFSWRSERGFISSVSGTAVVGEASACNFFAIASAGDLFWLQADGVTAAVAITSIETASAMTLSAAYTGGNSGSGKIWQQLAEQRTKIVYWLNRWFFANGHDRLLEMSYYPVSRGFQETGVASAWGGYHGFASASVSGGSLTATSMYQYYTCHVDVGGKKSNPVDMGQFVATTATSKFIVSASITGSPQHITAYRLYRGDSSAGTSAELDTARFVASAFLGTAITDDGTGGRSDSETVPVDCFMPPVGLEDLTIIDNRMAGISGSKLYISGLGPTDVHTDTAGRIEPEYWPYQQRIGDGEGGQGYAFLTMRSRTFILGQRNSFRVAVNGDDPAVWGVVPELPNVGCVNRHCIGNGGDRSFWLGYYRGDLTVLAFNGYQLQDVGAAVKGSIDSIDTAKFGEVEGGIGHGFYWLCIPLIGGTYRTLELNTTNGTWSYRDWQVQCFAQASAGIYGAFNDGLVNELESGYSKAGAAQTYQGKLAPLAFGQRKTIGGRKTVIPAPEWPAHFRSTQVEFKAYAGSPDVSASYVVDEGTPTAMPQSPVAITATPMFRTGLQTANYGRRWQAQFDAVGTDLDFAIRSIAVKGSVDQRDVD